MGWSINIDNLPLPMNDHQLSDLSKNSLYTIAMHTHTHPDLKQKEITYQTGEILNCKKTLKEKYGVGSNCLSYPFGKYDHNTIRAVANLKLKACFTTCASDIYADSKKNVLGRYQVFDESCTSLKNRLKI